MWNVEKAQSYPYPFWLQHMNYTLVINPGSFEVSDLLTYKMSLNQRMVKHITLDTHLQWRQISIPKKLLYNFYLFSTGTYIICDFVEIVKLSIVCEIKKPLLKTKCWLPSGIQCSSWLLRPDPSAHWGGGGVQPAWRGAAKMAPLPTPHCWLAERTACLWHSTWRTCH